MTWLKSTSADQWGTPNPPQSVTLKCRLNRKTRWVRNYAGQEVISEASILMREQPTHEDKFQFDGREHIVLSIAEKKAWQRSHFEVFVA